MRILANLKEMMKSDRANWIIGAAIAGIIVIVVLYFGTFLAEQFRNASNVSTDSPLYVGVQVAQYWPTVITFILVALLAVVGLPILAMLVNLGRSQGGNR